MSLNKKSDMAANSRGGLHPSRHSSRTPPFVLVGLLVVIAILGFNYWTTSAANRELDETLKSVNEKYASTNNELTKQNLELKSVRDENSKHRSRVEALEGEINLKTNQHTDIQQALENSQQAISKLETEYSELRQEVEQQEHAHDIELVSLCDIIMKTGRRTKAPRRKAPPYKPILLFSGKYFHKYFYTTLSKHV